MTSHPFSILDIPELQNHASACVECETCIDGCCTADPAGSPHMNPMGRLAVAARVLSGETPDPDEIKGIYYCTECGRCDAVCPVEIPVSHVIADTKAVLVSKGLGPLEKHDSMVSSILKNRNAVGKPADARLGWIPEAVRGELKFDDAPGDTLLYVGCLSSYVDTATAAASLDILRSGGIDFKLLSDEYCCGIYPYNAGKWEEALAIFTEMHGMLKKFGIRRIIVPCAGCHRCFSTYYPRLLPDFDIEVVHITDVIGQLITDGKLSLKPADGPVTLHDACKTGRKGTGRYELPREILSSLGLSISELPENREHALCCGSGSGVRSLDAKLSMKIAGKVLKDVNTESLISTCPFCIFNFNYTARKTEQAVKARHIATLVRAYLDI